MNSKLTIRITKENAYEWLLFCLIIRDALLAAISKCLSIVEASVMAGVILAIVMLTPLVLITIKQISKASEVFIFAGIYVLFLMLILIEETLHPQYENYYTRPVFGIYEVFFGIKRGAIWGVLAFAGLHKGKKVLNCFHWGAAFLLLYSLYEAFKASVVGYWETYDATGELSQYSYSLTFGYQVIFCCIVFAFFFLENKRWYDLMAAVLSFALVILEGSRGPLVCLAVFFILYLLAKSKEISMGKRWGFFVLIVVMSLIVLSFQDYLVPWLLDRIAALDIDSRTITMLLSGNLSSDNARNIIFDLCWQHISKQGFWGMGPFGNRTFIAPAYYWGYPHNIVLELILDYGWMIAIVIMAAIVLATIRIFSKAKKEELMVFCILLACNMKLFLSSTYWAEVFFWGMLAWMAVALTPYLFQKGKSRLKITIRSTRIGNLL